MENLWCAHFLVELTTAAEDYPVKNEETPGVATWGNYEKSMCNLTVSSSYNRFLKTFSV